VFPAIGSGTIKQSGTLKDLLFEIPYLLTSGLIPPIHVFNDVLRTGFVDAGMSGGCKWQPFEISQIEYEELTVSLNTNSDKLFKRIEVPGWVQSHSDWSIWRMEYLYGVPSKEHRRLQQEYDEIEEKRKKARESGDKELEESLYEKFLEIGERLSEFIVSHTRRKEG
jgi:hypothetical protein